MVEHQFFVSIVPPTSVREGRRSANIEDSLKRRSAHERTGGTLVVLSAAAGGSVPPTSVREGRP